MYIFFVSEVIADNDGIYFEDMGAAGELEFGKEEEEEIE